MRQFVVRSHTATTDPGFSLDDLAGGAGRMDVLCRCVNSAFLLSHGIREDVRVRFVLPGGVTLRFEGDELRYLNPDERNIASLIRSALEAKDEVVGHREVESTPGIYVSKRGFEAAIEDADGTVIQLQEGGDPVVDLDPSGDPVFVLSDHEDFTRDEEELLEARAEARVRLGPKPLHADHAITVAHNFLDTEGYTAY